MRLQTPRLIVRHLTLNDLEPMATLCADPVAMQYMGDGQPLSPDVTEQWIHKSQHNYHTLGYGAFAVEQQADGAFAGFCGLTTLNPIELIYAICPALQGRGYATEAAQAVTAFALEQVGLPKLVATTAANNIGSHRVLQKVGFQRIPERDYPDETAADNMVWWWEVHKSTHLP